MINYHNTGTLVTYQDLLSAVTESERTELVRRAVEEHKASKDYQIAITADAYDHQLNTTINNFVKTIMGASGQKMIDFTAANNKIASNFFHRLNTQRNMYSLGNGITFPKEATKKKLGYRCDTALQRAGYYALIHKVSFLFWNVDRLYVFPFTEFAPLWDEETSALGAGIRFYQAHPDKPINAVLYEQDGYSKYKTDDHGNHWYLAEEKRAYREKVYESPAHGQEVIAVENYTDLPIVPLWGSKLRQSTLVGMQQSIDSYDIIASGFANDLTDCAQIYWIIKNAGGMSDRELSEFRERLLLRHIATADGDSGIDITPYTQEIPYQSRCEYLDRIRQQIYENYGGFDCSSVSAAAKTATEINAAYQPMDENADDYEYCIIEAVEQLLSLQGIKGEDACPQFKRNRIANQLEQTQMVMQAASVLDAQAILEHLPWITVDEIEAIAERKEQEQIDAVLPEEQDEDEGENPKKDEDSEDDGTEEK